jgi:hypothetical protein
VRDTSDKKILKGKKQAKSCCYDNYLIICQFSIPVSLGSAKGLNRLLGRNSASHSLKPTAVVKQVARRHEKEDNTLLLSSDMKK